MSLLNTDLEKVCMWNRMEVKPGHPITFASWCGKSFFILSHQDLGEEVCPECKRPIKIYWFDDAIISPKEREFCEWCETIGHVWESEGEKRVIFTSCGGEFTVNSNSVYKNKNCGRCGLEIWRKKHVKGNENTGASMTLEEKQEQIEEQKKR